ncbi:MAG: hypothetical protein RMJ17_02740, partial [Candidatus Aenigmarchaeota archaeon]|nr:hypothetical protein [Candidatus Aenigmarchaeota archaeon]MDW8149485.1 hypothetical protein [Candidatus Aenigmarchaeota archaeon]
NLTTSHLSLYLGKYNYAYTLNNFLRNEVPISNVIYSYGSGLEFVPSSLDVSDLVNVNFDGLKEKIKENFINRDFVLIDCAPGFGREGMLGILSCDEILFVSNPNFISIVDIIKCLKILETHPVIPLGLVLNRVKNKKYEMLEEEIKTLTGLNIIGKIPEDENVEKSVNLRIPLVFLNKNSKAAREIIKISAFIAGEKFEEKENILEKIKKAFLRIL